MLPNLANCLRYDPTIKNQTFSLLMAGSVSLKFGFLIYEVLLYCSKKGIYKLKFLEILHVRSMLCFQIFEITPFTTSDNGIFVKTQGAITCCKSPRQEIASTFWQITLHSGVLDHEFTSRKYQNHEITCLN